MLIALITKLKKGLASISDITLIDTLIIFETLAIVNPFLEGRCFLVF